MKIYVAKLYVYYLGLWNSANESFELTEGDRVCWSRVVVHIVQLGATSVSETFVTRIYYVIVYITVVL